MTKQIKKNSDLPGKRRRISKNANIWEPEDSADKLYFAEMGRVKIVRLNRDGSEILLETVDERDFFGEACFTKGEFGQRKTMAKALCDCSIIEFSVGEFLEAIQKNQRLAENFINSVSRRMLSAEYRIAVLSSRRVENRLGNILFNLAAEKGIRTGEPFSLKMKVFVTHDELAGLTATSRQRITKTMNHFRKIGLVEYERTKPLIIDLSALEKYFESPNDFLRNS